MSDSLNTKETSQKDIVSQTEQLAAKVLNQNLVNLANKLKSGGTLSPAEVTFLRNEIEARKNTESPTVGFVKTQVELAEYLGVERKTIQRWLKEPGNPGARSDGRYPINEWKEWAEKNGKRLGEKIDATLERAKNIVLQNEILEFRLKVLRRDYVPIADVEQIGTRLAVSLRKVIGTLHLLAPSLEMVTVADAEELLKDKEDELISQLRMAAAEIEDAGEAKSEPIEPD